jgi:hypothetical protein
VEEAACQWTYAGASGPANWGVMCENKYPTCGTGIRVSTGFFCS